jgi:hypothetical protein
LPQRIHTGEVIHVIIKEPPANDRTIVSIVHNIILKQCSACEK